MLSRRTLLTAALPAMATKLAYAEDPEEYPTHAVTFIVPFARGGGTDSLARVFSDKLQEQFSQPFPVQNRPGEGTVIATNFVAKLAVVATVPFVLVVSPSLPVNNVDGLVALAKQRPLSYGSGGVGAFHHLAAAVFANMAGIKMTHVPYHGTAPALNDLIAGYTQLMFADLGPALPLISAGKLRPIAVTTTARLAALPNVPPLAQAGMPGFDMAAWQGMITSAKTPPDIGAKLNAKLNSLVATADVRGRMRDLGMNPAVRRTPEELARFLQDEILRWGKIVEAAGLAGSE